MHHDSAMPGGQATATLPKPRSPLGYTALEVAGITGMHRNTIYEWIKTGVLTSRQIRRTHYIPPHTVRALLDAEGLAL